MWSVLYCPSLEPPARFPVSPESLLTSLNLRLWQLTPE